MKKKILSLFLIFAFLLNSIHTSFAVAELISEETKNLDSQIKYSIESMKEYKGGFSLINKLSKVDNLINSIKDESTLNKILERIEVLEDKYNEWLAFELVNYIKLVVKKRLDTLITAKALNLINQIKNPELWSEDMKKVEAEVVKLQLSLLNSSKEFVDNLLNNLKDSLNVEEKWNLKINVEWSWAMIGSASWYLNMTDMKSKTATFNSEFESQVDLLIDASIKWEKAFKAQFSSFVNFINKDWNIYILLNKLNYSWIDNETVNKYLAKLKELAQKQTYLKIEDKASANFIELFKSFDLNSTYSSANKVLWEAMFKAYKKEWTKYYLYPTKKACDTIKYIWSKIIKSSSSFCSEWEYFDMLKSSIKNGDMYLNIDWTNNYFWFDIDSNDMKWDLKIAYQNNKISELSYKVSPKSSEYAWEYISFYFLSWKQLDFVVNVNSSKTNISLKTLLSSDNKITKIDYVWKIGSFNSKFIYQNKKFEGSFDSVLKTYQFDSSTNKFSEQVTWQLKWSLSWAFDLEDNLNSFNINIFAKNSFNKSNYDYKTWESKQELVNSTFDLDYNLSNETINWIAIYKENDKEKFNLLTTWKYLQKEYFEMNNKVSLNYDNDIANWNLNIKIKWDINKLWKVNYYVDFYSSEWYIKINIDSDYERSQGTNIQINAPTNYENIENIFPWEDFMD